MSDTGDSSDEPTGWALVNNTGDVPDDDSSSTASSVEIVEEDDDDDDMVVNGNKSPVTGSPSSPGPLFVLRLPGRNTEVSDTDDDPVSSEQTDSAQDSVPTSSLVADSVTPSSLTENNMDSFQLLHTQSFSAQRQVSTEEIEALRKTLDSLKDRVTGQDSVSSEQLFGDGKETRIVDDNTTNLACTELTDTKELAPIRNDSQNSSLNSSFSFVPRDVGPDHEKVFEVENLGPVCNSNMGPDADADNITTRADDDDNHTDGAVVGAADDDESGTNVTGEEPVPVETERGKRRIVWIRYSKNEIFLAVSVIVYVACLTMIHLFCEKKIENLRAKYLEHMITCEKAHSENKKLEGHVEQLSKETIDFKSYQTDIDEMYRQCTREVNVANTEAKQLQNLVENLKLELADSRKEPVVNCEKSLTDHTGEYGEDKVRAAEELLNVKEKMLKDCNIDVESVRLKNAELQEQLTHKDEQLTHKDEQLTHKDEQLTHKDEQIATLEKLLAAEKEGSFKRSPNQTPNWEACKTLMADMYEKQYENLNDAWMEMKEGLGEFAGTLHGSYLYEFFKQNGMFNSDSHEQEQTAEPIQEDSISDNEGLGGQNFKQAGRQSKSEDSSQHQKRKKSNEKPESGRQDGQAHTDWADSVFDMMNKTRGQIQHTWEKVKNMSDNMWKEHSPTIHRLHNSFTEKMNHLSDKFQEKLARKMNKWFKKSQNNEGKDETGHKNKKERKGENDKNDEHDRKGKNDRKDKNDRKGKNDKRDRKANQQKSENAKTKRRQFNTEDTSSQLSAADKNIIELSWKVNSLSARDFRTMKWKGAHRLLQLEKDILEADGSLLKAEYRQWLRCQDAWWRNGEISTAAPCDKFLCCWQVKVVDGNVKQCRKTKKKLGKFEDQCYLEELRIVGPDPKPGNQGTVRNKRRQFKLQKSTNNQNGNGRHGNKGDNLYNDDNTNNQEFKQGSNSDSMHAIPDIDFEGIDIDSYEDVIPDFDNLKKDSYKIDEKNTDKQYDKRLNGNDEALDKSLSDLDDDNDDDNDEAENWYMARAEEREYLHQQPDDWFFRRVKDKTSVYTQDMDDDCFTARCDCIGG